MMWSNVQSINKEIMNQSRESIQKHLNLVNKSCMLMYNDNSKDEV